MNELNIGSNIARLRKERGITQEALGEVVGLTAQAVSKWESGGSPDSSLLPVIADYFGVTIDSLYGRKTRYHADIQEEVCNYLASLPVQERVHKAYDMVFSAIPIFAKLPPNMDISEYTTKPVDEILRIGGKHTQIFSEYGVVQAGLDNLLRYFIIIPETDEGYRLQYKEELIRLFSMLSGVENLKALFFLYSRAYKHFTPKLLSKEFDITIEKAVDTLKNLEEYKFVKTIELEVDDEIMTIYEFNPNISFVPFMIFAEELIKRPEAFYFKYEERDDKPYLARREQ